MSRKQLRNNPAAHKTILFISIMWSFIALGYVYADKQYYVYPSDMINAKKNYNAINEREKWRYINEIPSSFQDSGNPDQIRYTYLPPVQQPGSNPITNPQRKYRIPVNSQTDKKPYVTGNQYNYPPPMQKLGTNPFTNPQHKYQFPANNLTDSKSYMAGKHYNYPPAVQRPGSNPFLNPNLQYDDSFIKKLFQIRNDGNVVSY